MKIKNLSELGNLIKTAPAVVVKPKSKPTAKNHPLRRVTDHKLIPVAKASPKEELFREKPVALTAVPDITLQGSPMFFHSNLTALKDVLESLRDSQLVPDLKVLASKDRDEISGGQHPLRWFKISKFYGRSEWLAGLSGVQIFGIDLTKPIVINPEQTYKEALLDLVNNQLENLSVQFQA